MIFHAVGRKRDADEHTPLLRNDQSRVQSPNSHLEAPNAVPSKPDTPVTTTRQSLLRAATTAGATGTIITNTEPARPLLSRPLLTRTSSSTAILQISTLTNNQPKKRPSLLHRATAILQLNSKTPDTYLNRPAQPSHWTDHAHRNPLLQIWDTVQNEASTAATSVAAGTKQQVSITTQLLTTEKIMRAEFGEVGEGDVVLTREWIEFVLGVCLRQPFCTADRMGRFEVLAASAGGRGNWGPW
ncbi:hypothetical protein LTR62_007628 [Meristemomyces frigidus]|uniref:Uncharacterized protein n=1 Tax=Meristemomyces frigidus TaxID=1508187 RepID=A0AAN7TAG7_9PEZI|nr:hypothetical protein LTR62_007628 [Meristemomyces frigidus]